MASMSSPARREHQHGRIRMAADLAADLEAVHLRQHQVEDHEVGLVAAVQGERLLAVGRGDHGVALLLEVEPHEVHDVAFVVDDKDRLHRRER